MSSENLSGWMKESNNILHRIDMKAAFRPGVGGKTHQSAQRLRMRKELPLILSNEPFSTSFSSTPPPPHTPSTYVHSRSSSDANGPSASPSTRARNLAQTQAYVHGGSDGTTEPLICELNQGLCDGRPRARCSVPETLFQVAKFAQLDDGGNNRGWKFAVSSGGKHHPGCARTHQRTGPNLLVYVHRFTSTFSLSFVCVSPVVRSVGGCDRWLRETASSRLLTGPMASGPRRPDVLASRKTTFYDESWTKLNHVRRPASDIIPFTESAQLDRDLSRDRGYIILFATHFYSTPPPPRRSIFTA